MLVVPAAIPVIMPLELTVPTAVLELLQVPPVVLVLSDVVVVGHTELVPDIAAGAESTDAVSVLEKTGFAVTHARLLSILHDTVFPEASVLLE